MPRKFSLLMLFTGTCVFFIATICYAGIFMWRDHHGIIHLTNIRPEWWTDDMDQMDPLQIQAPAEPTPYPGCFVGDKENRKFHLPSCEQIYTPSGKMAIPDEKIIWFDSVEDAISQGFRPCDHCKPTQSDIQCDQSKNKRKAS